MNPRGWDALTRKYVRMGQLIALFGCAFFCLLSCAPGQPGPVPRVEVPDRFSETGAFELPDRWWLSFKDPELNALIDFALRENPDILQAWYRLDQSAALARQAGARLSPTLDAGGTISRSWVRQDQSTVHTDQYQLGLTAGYEIDLWGRIRASRDAAAFEATASREDLQTTALALTSQLARVWFQLKEQRGQRALLADQQALNERNLELINFRFRAGKTTIADVLQQRQLIEANLGERALVESRISLLKHQLAVLLGIPAGQLAVAQAEGVAPLSPLPQTGVPAELIQRRPDVRSALYRVQASDQRVAVAIANRFPQISLTADLNTSGSRSSDLFDRWLSNLAGNLVVPLIDGGFRRAEVDRTRAAAGEAFQNYRQVILESLKEVEDALVQELRQTEYLESLQEQLNLADQVVLRVRDYYAKGVGDYLRVLTAQLSQQQLQRTYLTARLNMYEARIALCKALAGGVMLPEAARVYPEETQPGS